MSNIPVTPLDDNDSVPESPFEQIKRIDPDGIEFWSARDLMPLLEYASWQKFDRVCNDVYSSFCLENPNQIEIAHSVKQIKLGHGAIRKVTDWHVSRDGLHRVLSRVASYKPKAVRELRFVDSLLRSRIEIDLGAILYDFCDHAGLRIVAQYPLEIFYFDFCISDMLLIEVDEMYHALDNAKIERDHLKTQIAAKHDFKLLRIKIPFDNVAKLHGTIFRMLSNSTDESIYAEITQNKRYFLS